MTCPYCASAVRPYVRCESCGAPPQAEPANEPYQITLEPSDAWLDVTHLRSPGRQYVNAVTGELREPALPPMRTLRP